MKIGVTSQNFRTITGHAGKTRRFLVFSNNGQGQWQESERIDLPKDMSIHEFKGQDHPIDNLDVLITTSCGDGFLRKMANRGVKVILTSEVNPSLAVEKLVSGETLSPAVPHTH